MRKCRKIKLYDQKLPVCQKINEYLQLHFGEKKEVSKHKPKESSSKVYSASQSDSSVKLNPNPFNIQKIKESLQNWKKNTNATLNFQELIQNTLKSGETGTCSKKVLWGLVESTKNEEISESFLNEEKTKNFATCEIYVQWSEKKQILIEVSDDEQEQSPKQQKLCVDEPEEASYTFEPVAAPETRNAASMIPGSTAIEGSTIVPITGTSEKERMLVAIQIAHQMIKENRQPKNFVLKIHFFK
jgi:hypothetical protein